MTRLTPTDAEIAMPVRARIDVERTEFGVVAGVIDAVGHRELVA
ncbi:MAG: hypothetical protein ACHP7N_17080 [Caulobacterales bacterium]